MINFFNDYTDGSVYELPSEGPIKQDTGLLKAAGMGFMRGAADIASAATLATGGAVGMFEGGALPEHASDRVFKFYDDYIKPARDFWTPDPETVSGAGRLLGGITSLAPSLMLGPGAVPALLGSSTLNTSADLVEAGVDATTATGLGVLQGVTTWAMIALPGAGKTLAQTLALIGLNPVTGFLQEGASKLALESQGYEKQAEMFNPFDPVNRTLDLVLGGIFGGMAHYGKAREAMPKQFEDAIDTAALAQKTAKSSPFAPEFTGGHLMAFNKAVNDLTEGKLVDISEVATSKLETVTASKLETVESEVTALREIAVAEVKAVEAEVEGLGLAPIKPVEAPEAGALPDVPVEPKTRGSSSVERQAGKKKTDKPATLADFVRSQGGISSADEYMKGEVRDRFSIKAGYNLINNKAGKTLDALSETAWEAGYFDERPTPAALLDALREDVDARTNKTGKAVFAAGDKEAQFEAQLDEEFARYTAETEQVLMDNPDMTIFAGVDEVGNQVIQSAREYIDNARAEVEKAFGAEELFNMAANCLRRG